MIDAAFVNAIRNLGSITEVKSDDGSTHVFAPNGQHVKEIKPHDEPTHDHVIQNVELHQTESLIKYVQDFDDGRTTIFADAKESRILAVIDYHMEAEKDEADKETGKVAEKTGDPASDQHCEHRALLLVPFSEQWKRWTAIDGKGIGQTDFADFLEENYLDVATPDHADLLEIVTNLQAKNDVAFSSKVNLHNGQTQFTYEEKIEGKGKGTIEVPREIMLNIPIHFGGPLVKVRVFFRYRIVNGSLTFTMKINRRELMVQEAFEAIVTRIHDGTGCRTVYGKLT